MKLVFLECTILALSGTAFITACNGDAATPTAPTKVAAPLGSTVAGPDISLFLAGALARGVTTEACTLSGGTANTCYRITVVGLPVDHAVGPFCPPTPSSTAAEGGIWFDGDGLYDLDGEFIKGLRSMATTTGCSMTRTRMSTSPLPKKRSKARRGPMSPRNTRTIA